MLTKIKILTALISLIISTAVFAQDISVLQHHTSLTDTLNSEIIFSADVTNVSQTEQTVFLVRTINDLPPNWTSALCFDFCFADFVDSIATTPEFQSSPLQPGESREVALHVFPLMNAGSADLQVQIGTFANPNDRFILDFVATVQPTSVKDLKKQPDNYFLSQNYPNPFNPSTKINFGLKEAGHVSVKVYNILGNEIATLVNGYYSSGSYSTDFHAGSLSSGVYFYRITTNGYSEIRKMILEK